MGAWGGGFPFFHSFVCSFLCCFGFMFGVLCFFKQHAGFFMFCAPPTVIKILIVSFDLRDISIN